MMVHLATDIALLRPDPMAPWATFLPPHVPKHVSPCRVTPEHTLTKQPPVSDQCSILNHIINNIIVFLEYVTLVFINVHCT